MPFRPVPMAAQALLASSVGWSPGGTRMELLRALGAVLDRPDATVVRVATMLELPTRPTPGEHAFLFDAQLKPLARLYLDPDGANGDETRDRIAGYWRAVAMDPPDTPDHLGHMIVFYAELAARQHCETDAARQHALGRLRKGFLWELLLTWLPAYLTKVDLIAPRSYRRWAELLWQVATREAWTVGAPDAMPSTLVRLQAVADPVPGDVESLVTHLSLPARCGLVLAPLDLKRAADAAHLEAPAFEPRDALAALVRGRPAAVLLWLITEARRWETRHERNRDLLPALSDHWMRRARSTRVALQVWSRVAGIHLPSEPSTTGSAAAGRAGRHRPTSTSGTIRHA